LTQQKTDGGDLRDHGEKRGDKAIRQKRGPRRFIRKASHKVPDDRHGRSGGATVKLLLSVAPQDWRNQTAATGRELNIWSMVCRLRQAVNMNIPSGMAGQNINRASLIRVRPGPYPEQQPAPCDLFIKVGGTMQTKERG
jgi:hypothetical protein